MPEHAIEVPLSTLRAALGAAEALADGSNWIVSIRRNGLPAAEVTKKREISPDIVFIGDEVENA